jgi:hypothetical protein
MHTDAVILIISGRDHVVVFIDVVDYVMARDLCQGRSNQEDGPDECRRDECYEIMCVPVHIFLPVLAAD